MALLFIRSRHHLRLILVLLLHFHYLIKLNSLPHLHYFGNNATTKADKIDAAAGGICHQPPSSTASFLTTEATCLPTAPAPQTQRRSPLVSIDHFSFCDKMSRLLAFLAFLRVLQGALGDLVCEELPTGLCSFSIASSGRRCVLETIQSYSGDLEFQCKTSEITAMDMPAYIETDECVSACGVNRRSIGISSDSLLETKFTLKLCSPHCYYNCPNIVDLYRNMAMAEGVSLSELCYSQITSARRSVIQLQSSSEAASGPVSAAAGPISEAYGPASSTTLSSVDCAPAPL